MRASGIITITTDFGESDPYVAVMKGVILSINSGARIVDITHQVPGGSVPEGASILKEAYSYFPSGTVHLAVIDPGVGTTRRPIAVRADNHYFVGPDNGLFWPVIATRHHAEIVHLTEHHYWMKTVSPTFHGRDIFAPVAAHLSMGVSPALLGKRIDTPATIRCPAPFLKEGELRGLVIRVDHFGTLITNITERHLAPFVSSEGLSIHVRDLVVRKLSTTFSNVPEGEPLALIGSSGLLEIAVNRGRPADRLGRHFGIGTEVIVERKGDR